MGALFQACLAMKPQGCRVSERYKPTVVTNEKGIDPNNMAGPPCPNDQTEMKVTVFPFGFVSVKCHLCGEWQVGRVKITKVEP